MRTITVSQTDEFFSELLRDGGASESVVVTSQGRPVATIAPIKDETTETATREEAWRDLLENLRTRPVMNIPITWTRDDVYDDDF